MRSGRAARRCASAGRSMGSFPPDSRTARQRATAESCSVAKCGERVRDAWRHRAEEVLAPRGRAQPE